MIEHKHTDKTEVNFSKLEERLMCINDENLLTNFQFYRRLWWMMREETKPVSILVVATGGSKACAYYVKLFLEHFGYIAEVIEPRDYFYQENKHVFKRLIAISKSGTTNGIEDILHDFKGQKYLIIESASQIQEYEDCEILSWSNGKYLDQEKSFISMIPTLSPMLMLLDLIESKGKECTSSDLKKINQNIKELMKKVRKELK